MKQLFLIVLALLSAEQSFAQNQYEPTLTERIPIFNNDTLIRHHFVAYKDLPARFVDVWLPKASGSDGSLALLLAQDGQNIFDPSTAYGGQSWEMHLAVQKIRDSSRIGSTMVVGIWNSANRFNEYLPMTALLGMDPQDKVLLEAERKANPKSDQYAEWISQVLMPYLTEHYPITTNPDQRFLIGSSMGGLISVYLLAQLPELFGGAMCLSTHWPLSLQTNKLSFSEPYRRWLLEQMPVLQYKKLYMDYGDQTLDSFYAIHQQAFDADWQSHTAFPTNYRSLFFKQAAHNEASWRQRLNIPLQYMLAP